MMGSLSGKAKISLAGLLLTLSILSVYIYFAIAAPTTPSQVYLEGNTSVNYDKEGTFSVNWTASTDAQGHVANYTVWLMFVSNGTFVAYLNDSNTGVSLTSLPQANYSFNVSALNDTGTWGGNATLVWVIVDTTGPSVNFSVANDTVLRTDSGIKIDINVSDSNNNTAWVWASGNAGATNVTMTNINSNQYQVNTSPNSLGCTGDGTCTIRYFATDKANNTNGSVTTTVTADNTTPTISHTSVNDTLLTSADPIRLNMTVSETNQQSSPSWQWASGNGGATNVTMTSIATNNYQVNTTPSSLGCGADGTCTITFFTTDLANNTAQTTQTTTVDSTAPSVNFTSANDTVLRTDSGIKIDINVSDTNNNTAWVFASGDAGATNRTLTNTNNNQYQINTSPALLGCTADTTCTIRFFATDNANNTNYSATTSITTDNTTPAVGNLSLNVSSSKQNNSIRINVTVDDTNVNNNWVYVSGDGGATNRTATNTGTNNFQLNSTPFNLGCSPDAACTIRIFAVDNANNTNGSVTATLTVDDTSPTVHPVGYTNATQRRNNQQLTLNVQVSDSGAGLAGTCFIWTNSATTNNTVSVSSGWCNSTSINLTGASDGNQTLYILLNDTLGNTKVNNSFAIWIETTVPTTLTFVTPTPVATANLSQSFIALNLTFTESYTSYCIFEFAGVSSENFTNTSSALGSDRQCFYNKTGLADGNYTIRVYVNDTFGNINATSTRLIKLDTIRPSISFSCTPTEVSRTQTITCSCSATDNLTSVSGGVSYTTNPSTIDIGTFSTTCSATDHAGNTGTSSVSYTVTASGGFSGGGGGGGMTSTATAGTKVSYSFSSIEPSKPAEVKLENKNVGIDNIIIKTDATATGVSLDVTKLDSKPAAASSLTATSYKYIEIKAANLAKASITVDFKVEKSWITANNIEKNTVSLYRYSTSWNKMDTKIVKEDATYVYFQSYLTGFSIFSIAGETKKAECSTGAKRCAGNNVEQCSSEGKWVVTEACTNGCDTSSGSCITPSPQPQKPEEQEIPQPPQPPAEVETTAYSSQQTIFTLIALLIGLLAVSFLIKAKAKHKQKSQPRKNMFGF